MSCNKLFVFPVLLINRIYVIKKNHLKVSYFSNIVKILKNDYIVGNFSSHTNENHGDFI